MTSRTLPWLATAGAVGPILCAPVAVLAGILRAGYSMRRDNLSQLGVGPHAWLMDADLVIFGLFMLCLAFGLNEAFSPRCSAAGPAAFGAWALGLVAEGVFPTDPAALHVQTFHSWIHDTAYLVLVAALMSSCFVFARQFAADPDWCDYAAYSRFTGALIPALLCLFLLLGDSSTWKGLVERVLVVVMCAWVELVALRLRRISLGQTVLQRRGLEMQQDIGVQRA